MARCRSAAVCLLIALAIACADARQLLQDTCSGGNYWDATTSGCLPCGYHRYCKGGTAQPIGCPPFQGTETPTAFQLSDCKKITCLNICAGTETDLVFSSGSGATPANGIFVSFHGLHGTERNIHFVCAFNAQPATIGQLGDAAMLANGDILAMFTTGVFRIMRAAKLASMVAANKLDVFTTSCNAPGMFAALPGGFSLPKLSGITWGGLTVGRASNMIYASANQGLVASVQATLTGCAETNGVASCSVARGTTVTKAVCLDPAVPTHCNSNQGTDVVLGADPNQLYLWGTADAVIPFTGNRLALDPATGHLTGANATLTNRGIVNETDAAMAGRSFNNNGAICVNDDVHGMAIDPSTTGGVTNLYHAHLWHFGDTFDTLGLVPAKLVAGTYLRANVTSRQAAFKLNGAGSKPYCQP